MSPPAVRPGSYTVELCRYCHRRWADHFLPARTRLKREQPERFYTKGGVEYPLERSTVVAANVTVDDCAALEAQEMGSEGPERYLSGLKDADQPATRPALSSGDDKDCGR